MDTRVKEEAVEWCPTERNEVLMIFCLLVFLTNHGSSFTRKSLAEGEAMWAPVLRERPLNGIQRSAKRF